MCEAYLCQENFFCGLLLSFFDIMNISTTNIIFHTTYLIGTKRNGQYKHKAYIVFFRVDSIMRKNRFWVPLLKNKL